MRTLPLYLTLAAVLATRVGAARAAESDLVAHYSFDEGSGAVVHDRSGHGHEGRIHGAVEWVRTATCSALVFNGRDSYKYRPAHLENPDFDAGLDGWTVDAAEAGSVATKTMKGYSWLQGRYPPTRMGDTFLWTKRSARKPNCVAQPLSHLEPGRLYSLKMITADYDDLAAGRSARQKHAVSVRIEGVELVPEKCFQSVLPNNYAHGMGPFNARHNAWLNYHGQVFRARQSAARLVLTDWASPQTPGGPIGQTLMYNFVEVQPYFE